VPTSIREIRLFSVLRRRKKSSRIRAIQKKRAALAAAEAALPSKGYALEPIVDVRFPPDTIIWVCSDQILQPSCSRHGLRLAYILEQLAASNVDVHYLTSAPAPDKASMEQFIGEFDKTSIDLGVLEELGVNFHYNVDSFLDLEDESVRSKYSNDNSTDLTDENHKQPELETGEINAIGSEKSGDSNSTCIHDLIKKSVPKEFESGETMIILFDRPSSEEQFSLAMQLMLPDATFVLDLPEIPSLRAIRQATVESKGSDSLLPSPAIRPKTLFQDENFLRNLASIYRSDKTLVGSAEEMKILTNECRILEEKLCLAPITGNMRITEHKSWKERRDFVFVGNFTKPSSLDAVYQLYGLWPKIRDHTMQNRHKHDDPRDPDLYIYGAYCPPEIRSLHDPDGGFLVCGFHPSLTEILSDTRVLLAPLRFSAGISAKIVEAWNHGLPVVTTSMGSERLLVENSSETTMAFPGGQVSASQEEFVNNAAELYNNQEIWREKIDHPHTFLRSFCGRKLWNTVASFLVQALDNREQNRKRDFLRASLMYQATRRAKFHQKNEANLAEFEGKATASRKKCRTWNIDIRLQQATKKHLQQKPRWYKKQVAAH
jgi:glycosyltransferase involved in cell wall biosynthesis